MIATTIQRPRLENYLMFYYEYLPRIKKEEHKKWLAMGGEEEEEQEESAH